MNVAEKLGVQFPLIQAPMAGSQDGALALAVAGEGALGSLPCALLGLEALQGELARVGRAINLNFFCHTPSPPDQPRERAWRALLHRTTASSGWTLKCASTGRCALRSTTATRSWWRATGRAW
jgi:nitronate monooxygenase